jgi:hypothetical protein
MGFARMAAGGAAGTTLPQAMQGLHSVTARTVPRAGSEVQSLRFRTAALAATERARHRLRRASTTLGMTSSGPRGLERQAFELAKQILSASKDTSAGSQSEQGPGV